ncbi:DUF6531 domain-containing protein [Streptomyces sp. NBC_01016]|uniref:putative T7SS-secreted protein n=1 Tax=Streptomyces sp. NBC_01016 TaxID=2903720 RepID=UPI002250EA54|nr:DUF6531 domain-containing protein [Streptomyces sp. NBC_01016]MCX4834432.1 DUF6531 domain-containing protein [Streptomyces sp. NBC_01016]
MSGTITADSTPKDLIPGDVEQLETLRATLRAYAGAFADAKRRLRTVDADDWQGAAAMDFRSAVRHIPDTLDTAHESFDRAAKAVTDYADVLAEAQHKVRPIIEDAADARRASHTHQQDVDDYNAAVDRDADPLPTRPPETDPGVAAMDHCQAQVDKLREQVEEAAHRAKKHLDSAAEAAPDEPGWFSKLLGGGKNILKGGYEGLEGMGQLTNILVHPSRWGMTLASATDSMVYGAQHPVEFAKSVADWDTLKSEPARWVGRILPDAAAALVTGGASAAATRGARAADRIADRVSNLRRDGKGREDTDTRPDDVCRADGDKCKAGEPIDIATGEMSLTHTDLTLPGALPLVLTRTHLSNYGAGGWFGRSWAATLDQHLEVDEDTVVFAAADGVLLAYPLPKTGETAYPTHGAQWPLHRDDESDFRLTDPHTGRTLHFAEHPHTGYPLTGIEDRSGRRIDLDYDTETGCPIALRHSGGYHVTVETHPDLPRITALRMADTLIVTYEYDALGNLTGVTNSSGTPLAFTYDDADRVTSWTDRNDTTFAYVYDHAGRVLRTLGPDGMWSGTFRYEPAQRRTTYTDSLGHATLYEYDERNKLLRTTDPLGNATSQQWTPDGRHLTAVIDSLGNTTRYERDTDGNLTGVLLPDGTRATALYNTLHQPVQVTQPDGATWHYTYDIHGNRLSATDPTGATTTYAYDALGHLIAVTNALGHTRRVTNDAAGLPLTITGADGHTTTATRDAFGRPATVTDARGCTTHTTWSAEGRPLSRQHPDGTCDTWAWDDEGNLLTHTNRAGHTTHHTYTHFDLPANRTDADGAEFTFTYDTELRLTQVTNPAGLNWSYSYDAAGHLRAETDFNGRTLTYTHDAAGRLASRTNGAGETETFQRDAFGRTTARLTDDGRRTTFDYTPGGQLTAMSNPDAAVTYTHDPLGRVQSETVNGRTTAYGYDELGRRTSRTTPSGHVSTWTYGAGNNPEALSTSTGHRLDFGYDAAGNEITRTVDDSAFFLQTFDAAGHLSTQSLHTHDLDTAPLQHRSYTYRADGYLTEITESGTATSTRRFDLTPTGRATVVRATGWSESYAYDSTGNLSSAATPVTEDSDGLRETTGTLLHRAGRTHYTYDTQGRLTRRTRRLLNGQKRTWTYAWNTEDRLTGATTPDGTRWRYTYDPTGRRIAKHRLDDTGTSAESVHFTWDGTRLAEQATTDGTVTTWDYTPGTHRPLAQTLTQADVNARFHAIVTDLVGTPTELVTPDGEIEWQQRTTLWGAPFPAVTTADIVDCPLRFPGQYIDTETGLYYNNQRYYDPETARYLSPDPLGLRPAVNHHAYVANPLAWIDALGLKCEDPLPEANSIAQHANERFSDGALDHHVKNIPQDKLANYVSNVLEGDIDGVETRYGLNSGRTAYWDPDTGAVVIEDPGSPHGGSVFTPQEGHTYFEDLE